jgi:hypothetical protein
MEDATAQAFRAIKEYPIGEPTSVGDQTEIRAAFGKLYPIYCTATLMLPIPLKSDIGRAITVVSASATGTVTVVAPDGIAINAGTSSSVTAWLTMRFVPLSETQYVQC